MDGPANWDDADFCGGLRRGALRALRRDVGGVRCAVPGAVPRAVPGGVGVCVVVVDGVPAVRRVLVVVVVVVVVVHAERAFDRVWFDRDEEGVAVGALAELDGLFDGAL